MGKISSIEATEKYCKVFIDGVFACSLTPDTVYAHFLKEGKEISPESVNELILEDEGRRAVGSAMNYISYCSRTQKQVRENLTKKGYSPGATDHAIKKLGEYGYINDEQYAKMYAHSMAKKMGPRLAKSKLMSKGISGELLENVTEDVAQNQLEHARVLYDKLVVKYAALDEQKRRQRIYAALMRKGFEWSEVSCLFDAHD